MARFLFLYRGDPERTIKMSPDEMQQILGKWQAWIEEGLRKGWMVDAGDALTHEGRVLNAGQVVTDGPFVEAKEVVGGYSIVQADSLDAAVEHARGCPVLLRGGRVEIRTLAGFTTKKPGAPK
jgi:hypothetical protein